MFYIYLTILQGKTLKKFILDQPQLKIGVVCIYLGDAGVGKTSIARRFVDDAFLTCYIHTIGIDFLEKIIEVEQKAIKLQIWDTAGQDR